MESHASIHPLDSNDILLVRSHPSWSPSNGINRVKLEKSNMQSFSQPHDSNNLTTNQIVHSNVENETRLSMNNSIDKINNNINKEFYKCQFCLESFTTKQALKHHKDCSHNERKSFRCTYANCLRAFTSANYLKNHVDIEHTDSTDSRIPCPKKGCGLVFPNNYRLKRHIRQDHKQEKLYHCTFCDRKFASLEVRNNHINIKHSNSSSNDMYPMQSRNQDSSFYRSEQSKESENDTIYAASPVSSRLKSISERLIDDTFNNEGAWITKANDSNPLLSKQIDAVICDILSDNFQEKPYSPLSTNELAIAILSLEEVNEQIKHNAQKLSPNQETLVSECNSPRRNNCLCLEMNKKHSMPQGRLKNSQKYAHSISQISQQNILANGPNYPQSNTESEGHSTESQRSFLINSSQHEEFSDISMESHLKDVFSSTGEQWSMAASVRAPGDSYGNHFENPIKSLDYSCLDTMFDDFHEIIMSDNVSAHPLINGHALNQIAYNSNLSNQKNHLLSLNNMHSKFLGGSQPNNLDFSSNQLINVPSNANVMLSNYEMSRRKLNNACFINNKMQPGSYDMTPHYVEHATRNDVSYSVDGSSLCRNGVINGTPHRQEPIPRTGLIPNYPYNSSNIHSNNQINHNRVPNCVYMQSNERPGYSMCLNGSLNSNQLYQNSVDPDFISDPLSQNGQYPGFYRRRAPQPYQATYSHQMLPSQHSAPLSHCPPSSMQHRNSCFHPHNRSVYALPHESSPSMQQQQQQQQRQRHLLSDSPIIDERQGQQPSNSHNVLVSTDNNPFSECEDSIVSEEQSSSPIISSEQTTNHVMTISNIGSQNVMTCLSNPDQSGSGFTHNCDIITDAKSAVCL